MPSAPLTSIVLVSFHTGPDLDNALATALAQTAPVEVVVVNNGNPDSVVEALRAKAASEPRFKLVDGQGNVGFGTGNNFGVKASSGAFVLILNPDCKLRPDTVEKLLAHAASLKSPLMIGARILNENGTDQRGCRRELLTPLTAFVEAFHLHPFFPRLRLNQHEHPLPDKIAPVPAISGAFMFMPRKDFDLIDGFDESFFLHVEDLDMCWRFRKAGGEIYFAPDVPVTHVGGTSDVPSDVVERHKTRSFVRYFHNNFKRPLVQPLIWALDICIWTRYYVIRALRRAKPGKTV